MTLHIALSDCSFRLIDEYKRTITAENQEGLLLYNGGTVCDDDFSDNSGTAICKLLGFQAVSSWRGGNFWSSLQNTYSTNLDDVICSSPNWSSCTYDDERENCNHHEDIFLACRGRCYQNCGWISGCSPGQYFNSRSCTPCPTNTYSAATGIHTSCTACPGESVSQEGASQCLQCPSGSTAEDSVARCTCDKGLMWEWTSRTNASCGECPAGTYKAEGMLECLSCPEYANSTAGSENCSCVAGKFWLETECRNCEEGTYKTEGMVECLSCPENRSSSAGSEICSCKSGMYWNNTRCYHCTGMSASPEGAIQCSTGIPL